MSFSLPALPFANDALKPFISPETFDYHHGKHHKEYVDKLNKLIKGTEYEKLSLEEIIMSSHSKKQQEIFNNAAQHFNHTFFWHCLQKNGGGEPQGELADKIKQDFGSYKAFREEFKVTAEKKFGSGWAFLEYHPKSKKLAVHGYHNAETPLINGAVPILALDVWEHSFYIDYRNEKPKFIEAFLDHCVNWDFATRNYSKAL